MKMQAKVGNGKTFSTTDLMNKERTPFEFPVIECDSGETLVCGFRAEMLSMGDAGSVSTGSGLGTDFIILEWGKKSLVIRGSEMLRAWVRSFDPDSADLFPKEVKEIP